MVNYIKRVKVWRTDGMSSKRFLENDFVTAEEIKNVRKKLGLTQKEFSELTGCSKPTVERWEREDGMVRGPISLLVRMLEQYPEYIKMLEVPEKIFPIRMWYMYKNRRCTLIDVDEVRQLVRIKNYTENIMFQAFGSNSNPDFAEYQEFLKSRCFPETRDKIKLVLKDLDIPFYDPYLIIQKTEGRMAEDDFWILIEK